MPTRITLHRTKGWRKPENAVKIARPTHWGNPFQELDQAVAAEKFKDYFTNPGKCADPAIEARLQWMREHIEELRGKDLGCWCSGPPCHGDTLLEAANREQPIEATPAAKLIAEVVKETVPPAPVVVPVNTATIADTTTPPAPVDDFKFAVKWEIQAWTEGVVKPVTMERDFKDAAKAEAYCEALHARGINANVEPFK